MKTRRLPTGEIEAEGTPAELAEFNAQMDATKAAARVGTPKAAARSPRRGAAPLAAKARDGASEHHSNGENGRHLHAPVHSKPADIKARHTIKPNKTRTRRPGPAREPRLTPAQDDALAVIVDKAMALDAVIAVIRSQPDLRHNVTKVMAKLVGRHVPAKRVDRTQSRSFRIGRDRALKARRRIQKDLGLLFTTVRDGIYTDHWLPNAPKEILVKA